MKTLFFIFFLLIRVINQQLAKSTPRYMEILKGHFPPLVAINATAYFIVAEVSFEPTHFAWKKITNKLITCTEMTHKYHIRLQLEAPHTQCLDNLKFLPLSFSSLTPHRKRTNEMNELLLSSSSPVFSYLIHYLTVMI